MSDVEIEMNGIKIMKITTSQSETVQAKQFEGNSYFTSMEVDFGTGLDLSDVKNFTKVLHAAGLANTLCTLNNRRCEWRDGLAPRTGASAAGYLEANKIALASDKMYTMDNVIDAKNLGKFAMTLRQKLLDTLNGAVVASVATNITKENVAEAGPAPSAPSPEAEESPKAVAPAAKRRVNPARTATPTNTTEQKVVN